MARISGADPRKQGLLSGLLTRIVYGMTKRKLGRLVMPVRIAASLEDSLGLWADGAVATREPAGGRGIKGFGAVAGSHASGVPILN